MQTLSNTTIYLILSVILGFSLFLPKTSQAAEIGNASDKMTSQHGNHASGAISVGTQWDLTDGLAALANTDYLIIHDGDSPAGTTDSLCVWFDVSGSDAAPAACVSGSDQQAEATLNGLANNGEAAASIEAAINSANPEFHVTAEIHTLNDNRVQLTNDQAGANGNVTITEVIDSQDIVIQGLDGGGSRADHDIRFSTPSGVDSPADNIVIAFPTGWDLSSLTAADVALAQGDLGDCNNPSIVFNDKILQSGAPGAGIWGVSFSGQRITLSAPIDTSTGEIITGRCVQIRIGLNAGGAAQIVNANAQGPAGADQGDSELINIGGTFGDKGNIAVALTNRDIIFIQGRVEPIFNFDVLQNLCDLGVLDVASTKTCSVIFNVDTNAGSGVSVEYSAPNLLTNGASQEIDPISNGDGNETPANPGTEQFGMRAYVSNTPVNPISINDGAATGDYNGAGYAMYVSGGAAYVPDTAQDMADILATSVGGIDNNEVTIEFMADIQPLTPAGVYTTDYTIIATATY
ncbi:MAG: hypothetical protein GF332_01645 [Candidatus Moranbacteria bacterium]|nr:hypothetical protein [Candidatus Moranbacteria bacterium]